jgi:hypothetical protein
LDRVSVWLRTQWYNPNSTHPNLWFAAAVARAINWPDTLVEVGFPKRWDSLKALQKMRHRAARGEKVYTGAYMLRSDAMDKPFYTCIKMLDPLWGERNALRPRRDDTLRAFHERLMNMPGWGSFLAAQVVADLKYTPLLVNAPDWDTFAASGPGSKRGLNRVMGRDVSTPWVEQEWLDGVLALREYTNTQLPKGWEVMHAQDVQNCLCEFDKYQRVLRGEGKPRSSYKPQF